MQKLPQWQEPDTELLWHFYLLKSGFGGTTELTVKDLLAYYLDRSRYLYSQSKKHEEFLYVTSQCNAVWLKKGKLYQQLKTRSFPRKKVSEVALVLQRL